MPNQSFTTRCQSCDQPIRLTNTEGDWHCFDEGASGYHRCQPEYGEWALASLGHSFTCRTNCWDCGDEVFFHTNGHGDAVLFDQLGGGWPIHPCWERSIDSRNSFRTTLESALRKHSYSPPQEEFDLIRLKQRIRRPTLIICLSAHDHRACDRAVAQISNQVNEACFQLLAIPLPTDPEALSGEQLYERVLWIRTANDSASSLRQQALFQRLKSLDLPTQVAISIKQR